MNDIFSFRPAWKRGLTLHILLSVVLAACGGGLLWLAFQQRLGGFLILCLLGTLGLLGLLVLVVYRAYALFHASYTIEREGLRIRWGLRREDIPLTEMEWVRPAHELIAPLKRPSFSMQGALLGMTRHPDLGEVEFIASDYDSLVVVETANQVLALSPEDAERFVQTFQRTLEMGSITPIEAYTAQPAEFIQSVFTRRFARVTLISSLLLTLLLAVLTSLLIPYRQIVSMGIDAAGRPLAPVAANHLLILPLLGGAAWIADVVLGFYFFHEEDQHYVSFLLWSGAVLTPVLLMIALLIMVL